MNKKTENRIAVVTGGSGGIGFSIAKKLTDNNLITTIVDIQKPENEAGRIHFIQCDVTKKEQIDRLCNELAERNEIPDVLVCNAGRGIHETLLEGDPDKWQQAFEINVMGALRCIRAFAPGMLKKGFGDVVIISSVSAGQVYEYGGIYAASKTALEALAETLRKEAIGKIRVTVISPGVTDTGFFKNMISGNQSIEAIGYGALSPDDVAGSVWYALSKPKEIAVNKIIVRPSSQTF